MAKSKNESINISIFTALKVSEMSGVPVLIMSNPGLGKSTTVSMFAKVRGYELQLLRGNSTTAEEVLGYDVADQNKDSKSTIHLRPSWFDRVLKNEEKGLRTLLFLDEITTANEFVQSALLHLIFERMVGDEPLPKSTLIVSAGNYAQNLSNQMNLLPPLMNRFMIYNITPEPSDLDTFLCKYKGSIASKDGIPEDYMETLYNQMKELDSQEIKVSESVKNKIGEYIEKGVATVTNSLMKSGEKPVDLAVRDLQGIYSDIDESLGNKLYGFVTYRTLNYLRDVAISTYICFGKAGIQSKNFKNMIDGLCGVGVSMKKSGSKSTAEVKTTIISNEYFDMLKSVSNDIEKLNNSSIVAYEKFFSEIIDSKTFDIPKMQSIINKVAEMRKDQSLENIDRPINPEVIEKMCKIIKDTASDMSKIKLASSTSKVSDSISSEELIGLVTTWNTIVDTLTCIDDLVKNDNLSYRSETKSLMDKSKTDIEKPGYRLRAVRKLLTNEDPGLGSIIPEVRGFVGN